VDEVAALVSFIAGPEPSHITVANPTVDGERAVFSNRGSAHSSAGGFRWVSIGLGWILLTAILHVPTSLGKSRTNIFTAPFVAE
jgi:hypothetical protein